MEICYLLLLNFDMTSAKTTNFLFRLRQGNYSRTLPYGHLFITCSSLLPEDNKIHKIPYLYNTDISI